MSNSQFLIARLSDCKPLELRIENCELRVGFSFNFG